RAPPIDDPGGEAHHAGHVLLSDDLEITLELPPRHRALELPALPVAGPDVMIHERRAQQLARLLRFRKPGGRFAQGAGQGWGLRVVTVALRLGGQRELALDAVEPTGDRRR